MIFKWKPNQIKFKRLQKGSLKKCCFNRSSKLMYKAVCGLRILKTARLTIKQLEQARRKILTVRKKKEKERIWVKCLPDIPVTSKPLGIRMGKGKGSVDYWVFKATAGKIIFNMSLKGTSRMIRGLTVAQRIMPVPTKIYFNNEILSKSVKFKVVKEYAPIL